MIDVYGLKQCGTCRKARDWLDAHGVPYRFIDYREQPVPEEILRRLASQISWEKLVNRSGPTWRNLPEARKSPGSEAEWLKLVRDYPGLIRRPLVVAGERLSVGFSDKRFAELIRR